MAELLQFPVPAIGSATAARDDAEERAQALDTRSSCIVEAPAGSGKTGLLVQRYLKLLGEETVELPEEVLAITFTKKATAELLERVFEQLQAADAELTPEPSTDYEREVRAAARTALERSKRLGWALLERPSRLNIRSIDSVCSEIANSLPLLSGEGGPRRPLEDADRLYRLAARRTLLQLGGEDAALNEALRTVLLHRDGSLLECERLLAEMLQTREQWGEFVPLTPGALDEAKLDCEMRLKLERSIENIVCAGLSRALCAMPAGFLEELTSLAAGLASEPGYKGGSSPIALCADRQAPPSAAAEDLAHWRALTHLLLKKDGDWRRRCSSIDMGFEIPSRYKVRLEQLILDAQSDALLKALRGVRALPPAKYPEDQWVVAKALFHLLRRALAELRLLFVESDECDFTELALAAREALRSEEGSADAALAAGGTLRHLLVDEMQDTSSGQYELLYLLTRSWDGHTQTLFLVGDPKQSIYLFRQARVERFLRTMKDGRIGSIKLKPLRLTSNFRSQETLVSDFNGTFELLFPRPNDETLSDEEVVDVPFVAARAVRPKTGDLGVVWHPILLEADDPRDDHAAQEARSIRRVIEARMLMPLPEGRTSPHPLKPWRIAVLGRAKSHLRAIISEFKQDRGNGVLPFRAIDLDALDELPEVMDALALTRALLHPADRIAWLAVLHAPWCGLGVADLLALVGEGEGSDSDATIATLVKDRHSYLSELGQQLLDRAWPVLETAVKSLGQTSLTTHVERTWRSLGGDVTLSEQQRGHVLQYFRALRELESEGDRIDLPLLAARLKKLYAAPISSAEEHAAEPIALMTIHKAKGLEWDLVLVPGIERGAGRSTSVLLNWLEFDDGEAANAVLAPIWEKGTDADELSSWLSNLRAQRELAECKRMFYVATTRAREELHLFGAVTLKSSGEIAQPRYDSLLRACWPAASEHFAALMEDSSPITGDSTAETLTGSLRELDEDEALALAACGESVGADRALRPIIQRLPLSFDPAARFRIAAEHRLDYPAASALHQAPAFARPEGSFAVRAFGNVVHRYLQVIAKRLDDGATCDDLLTELPNWEPRLRTSLHGEGLALAVAAREASRAQRALSLALRDPAGRWILSPQLSSASESSLTLAGVRSLRVDRTFLAGDEPMSSGGDCIWIVDYKTTEQGSRTDEEFEAAEIAKYSQQLEAYAALRRILPGEHLPIRLGLFYPLVPRLMHWLSVPPAELADSPR